MRPGTLKLTLRGVRCLRTGGAHHAEKHVLGHTVRKSAVAAHAVCRLKRRAAMLARADCAAAWQNHRETAADDVVQGCIHPSPLRAVGREWLLLVRLLFDASALAFLCTEHMVDRRPTPAHLMHGVTSSMLCLLEVSLASACPTSRRTSWLIAGLNCTHTSVGQAPPACTASTARCKASALLVTPRPFTVTRSIVV